MIGTERQTSDQRGRRLSRECKRGVLDEHPSASMILSGSKQRPVLYHVFVNRQGGIGESGDY